MTYSIRADGTPAHGSSSTTPSFPYPGSAPTTVSGAVAAWSSYPGQGIISGALPGPEAPAPLGRPLRVTHVGQSLVRAGIESFMKSLSRFLDRRVVDVVKYLVTPTEYFDPVVAAELGAPVERGEREAVRQAARESDVLLCWGPRDLGDWLHDCRPPLCVFVAHGEGYWTRYILDGCRPIIDHVIAVSGRVRDRTCAGLPTTVIPNGVDCAQLAPTRSRVAVRAALGFAPDDFVLGYVGRFSEEKRPQVLIEAVARLPASFKALLVGWGPMQAQLLDLANERIPGRYAFTTAVNDVGDYYAALDALCLLSQEEGFALVILEAMMTGRPVIVTPVGCVPEFIQDRVTGLVVSGEVESVCAAAELLRRHPAWAQGLAAEARAHAEQHGHARLMARRYQDLLVRLWTDRERASPPCLV